MRSIWPGLALLLLAPLLRAADAQVYASADQSLPLFGRLGSARLAALGGAFNSLVQGSDALLVNPAGIASIPSLEAGANHESWLADINEETLWAVTPVGEGHAFGAYAHVIDYGVFELRDDHGQRLGDMSARDYAVGAAFGLRSRLGFSGGIGVRGVRENLIDQDLFVVEVDSGVDWQGDDGWSGGLVAANVGSAADGSQGSQSVRWGVAHRFDWSNGWFWPALGFSWSPAVSPRMQFGGELRINGNLNIRAGYEHRFVETLVDGVSGLSLGLGFRVAGMTFDYAFLPVGDLGAGHRVSVTWSPSPPKPKPTPAPEPPVLQVDVPPPQPDLVYVTDPLAEAQAMEQAGRLGEALAEYERVCQEHPDLPGAWHGVADLAYRLKDRPKALHAYEQLLRLEPNPDLARWLDAYRREKAP